MKRFATLIVALAMVLSLTPALQVASADAGSTIRDNTGNKPATMIFNRWNRVGYDRDGNRLNPSNLDPASIERAKAGGTSFRLFPWQKPGQEVWGRPSVNFAYELPRIIPTQGYSVLGRETAGNRDFNNNYQINQYAFWTEVFFTVTPNAGESQLWAHWYVVLDMSGNLWFDPDGVFHNCGLDVTADPMFYITSQTTYNEGSCLSNPKATLDPIPTNNTQGPYSLNFQRVDARKVYFWWKFDQNMNSVDRVWKLGWADMNDYDPLPNPEFPWGVNAPNLRKGVHKPTRTSDSAGICPPTDADIIPNRSVVSYISSYDPYLNTCLTNDDIDWDFKLNTTYFIASTATWPACTAGSEVFFDANNNNHYDPYEAIYRKGPNNNGNVVQADDVRLMNMSVKFGTDIANYKWSTNVGTNDLDFLSARVLKPLNPGSGGPGFRYIHTHGQQPGNPNDIFEFDEFIYEDVSLNPLHGYANLSLPAAAGATSITVSNTAGFAIGDAITIQGNTMLQSETRIITSIVGNVISWAVTQPLINNHLVLTPVFEPTWVEIGDYRLTNVNHRHNNAPESWQWHGAWWNDVLIMLEVLKGGCHTPMYNITVESDVWEGMIPAITTAALRSPTGDIVGAAQHIQKTTVLDPNGIEFRVPATVFENIKLEYREYIGVEIFKDDGINNNLGGVPAGTAQNCLRSSLSDDYDMWNDTEEYIGCNDEDVAKDYFWSTAGATRPFFADERFVDVNNDGMLGANEPMYRDLDNSLTPSVGDVRINDITIDHNIAGGTNVISYQAGSIVTEGDRDVLPPPYTWQLVNIPPAVRYRDLPHGCEPANNQYDIGEPVYFNPALATGMQTIYDYDFATGYDAANWLPIDETNSGMTGPFGPTSFEDPLPPWPPGQRPSPNEVQVAAGTTPPLPFVPSSIPALELTTGKLLLRPSFFAGSNQHFESDVHYAPNAGGWTGSYYGSFGFVFRYLWDGRYHVALFSPYSTDFVGDVWNSTEGGNFFTSGMPAPNNMFVRIMEISEPNPENLNIAQAATRAATTMTWDPNQPIHILLDINGNSSNLTITTGTGAIWNVGMTHADPTPGGLGFTKLASDNWVETLPAYILNAQLLRPQAGAGDIVRLVPVTIGDVTYPAGSRVLAGDFYRVKNPIVGFDNVTHFSNCSNRYMDIEVHPGDIGLKVEIDKPLKVEQTSHMKISVDPPPEGAYLTGKVICDKRTRLYYRPDSFLARMIPPEFQVIYSSPEEAKRNFYKPDFSVKGDVVYISLRGSDTLTSPYRTNPDLRELYDKMGIIDSKHPMLEWEYTPYRGTVLDNIGQEQPVLVKAYLDRGGPPAGLTPIDSRFTYAFNFYNSANRATGTNEYYFDNDYVDPYHQNRKWDFKESYASYYNQAYTRAARIIYSPYELNNIADCSLADTYDCFGMAKLHVDPEAIGIVPSSPCVDPLSYRYPNISLTLNAYDNPNDVNDPAGFKMAVAQPPNDRSVPDFPPVAVYNINGAGIKYMCMVKWWNRSGTINNESYYIIQVNDDGSGLYWQLNEPTTTDSRYPQIRGCLDTNDSLTPSWNPNFYPYMQSLGAAAIVDNDCSVGSGVVDICGSGWPPLGDVTRFDTSVISNPEYSVICYGVRSAITYTSDRDPGGKIAIVCQPMNANSKLNIRVHTTNLVVDYNNSTAKQRSDNVPWSYFIADVSGVHNAITNAAGQYTPGVSLDYQVNPPGIRYYSFWNLDPANFANAGRGMGSNWQYSLEETIDYCDVVSLKVMPPNPELNFSNFYVVDHALQNSRINYTSPSWAAPDSLMSMLDNDEMNISRPLTDPTRWIRPRYNPLCVLRSLSSDNNTDVRSYPGGQTNLMRVQGSLKGPEDQNFNAYPSLWPRQFSKLGTEFYGLTDYGVYFEMVDAPFPGAMGRQLSISGGTIRRVEVKGPFMTPLDIDPRLDQIRYRPGTGAGSVDGYAYKGLRYVPIRYDYSGVITVDPSNYQAYELGPSNFTNIASPGCTQAGDRLTYNRTNPYLLVGRELYYNTVWRSAVRVFVFDELIPIGAGRIDITVWLPNGSKKFYQDCCVEPPATGVDVAGIKIEGMPNMVTVGEATTLKLKLTEGYGIESEGPPVEFGKKIQTYKECNDAFVYVWQDRGILDPVDKLYYGAGDGYVTLMPGSTTTDTVGTPYTEDQDLNGDGKISFDQYETEILGSYDMASNTWVGGIIDARTFQRQDGYYTFALDGSALPTTVGIDFGAKGSIVEPDHVIGEDEMLDITVTAYKYGDDDNSRSFRPFWGGRESFTERAFSHEVYLAGQAASYVEAKPDLTAEIIPALLTAGCTPELLDPTQPLTFIVRDANQKPVNLSRGVPDPRGGDEVKIDNCWINLVKDPHLDNQYYYPGQVLPQYYWLRTDLHNEDYTPICNKPMYSYPRNPFEPIKFNWDPPEGKYWFRGFVANDKGSFDVHIYTPDRKHKAVRKVEVGQPKVSYDIFGFRQVNTETMTATQQVPGDPDFVCTSTDRRIYQTIVTIRTAEGKLIQGIAETTSVCMGGKGQNARFTPFFTRSAHYDYVAPPTTALGASRRTPTSRAVNNYWMTSDGGRLGQLMLVNFDGTNIFGDTPEEQLYFGWQDGQFGIRTNGRTGLLATYYPTVNKRYDDGTYQYYQAWDGPFDKIAAPPDGYGVGSIYNDPYEKLYVFADLNRDFRLAYNDSLLINNRGQGVFMVFADDACKYGVLVGVTDHALMPAWSDVYGGSDPYNEFSPQSTALRFFHQTTGQTDLGTNDGAYFLDWDALPDKYVEVKYPTMVAKWAETGVEVGKEMFDKDNYDLAYGIENHLLIEVNPADSRDMPMLAGSNLSLGNIGDYFHPWGGNRAEFSVWGSTTPSPVNPRTRVAQMYVTPTGTGANTMTASLYTLGRGYWPHPVGTAFNVIKFDVIMSLEIAAETKEPLKVGKQGELTVYITEKSGKPVPDATVHIKGAGVEMEKKTNSDGKAFFNISPTERGKILIEASAKNMKDSYTYVFVESFVAPPTLNLDPVQSIVGTDSITITGRTNQGTRVTVSGKPVTVAADGKFSTTVKLNQGINIIVVTATNGTQTMSKVIRVESRTQPSGIIIDSLGNFENVQVVRVRGHVEPGCKVLVTSDADGKPVEAAVANDIFIADVAVKAGNNVITVDATDVVGKKSNKQTSLYVFTKKVVQFQVGSDIMIVDGMPKKLTSAPTQTAGATMIPLRAFGEAFGAEVSFDNTTKTITIKWESNVLELVLNKTQALLNATPVTLLAAPKLIGGSTMVHIRTAEFFTGTTIEYNATTKTIVITRKF